MLGLGQSVQEISAPRMELINSAELLVAGKRLHGAFPDYQGRRITLKAPLAQVMDELEQVVVDHGPRVVVLVGGDPCYYGIGPLLVQRLGPERVRLHPGTTTLQAAASLLGLAWQHVGVVSLHGRNGTTLLFAALARNRHVAVYTDDSNTPAAVATMVLERGGENFRMWVFEDLGTPEQRWGQFTLEQVLGQEFSPLNLVLLERTAEPELQICLGMAEKDYCRENGLITKRTVRAAVIAALALQPDNLLWDLGAGCGSVGLEAGLLLPQGGVTAVEREPRRVAMIRENIRRTNAFWLQVVQGRMPECLHGLPVPDRIFIGGGLSGGMSILEEACMRLKPGGRLVASVVLLQSLERIRDHLEHMRWPLEILQIQASHAVPLAGGHRLQSQNPIFLVCTLKPEDATP
ncbi:precorrin-6Y C5,15-methyltransferase (decarboxylating) [Desulfonatronum thiosulfatophilum]|uniref:Precorrin-6Y C5,15-methyltransferase (Decarboxylating) n=1 Tax=Desulfonatronum thiosulfatophilum TaxID=617002 RepID=A0A1G6BAV2_9BACT|nr:precorrin-6Y C5,15-methyltransferase (decarboxylating) [Desulfonatronum thiosulfatophilum]